MTKRFFRLTQMSLALAMTQALAAPLHAESLRAAVQAAVSTNPAARAEDANVRATAFDLLQNERAYLPTVTATADVTTGYYNDPARLAPGTNARISTGARAGVVAEYTIFDGYRRANTVYRDAARVDGAIFGLLDATETLALSAVEAYVDVLRHRQLMAISQGNVGRHQGFARQVYDLVDGGRLPVSERFEVDQRVMAARLNLVEVKQALADAEARYEAIMGHKPGRDMAMTWASGLPMTLDGFVMRAVKANHSVKVAQARIREAEFEAGIAKSGDLPQVTARAGADVGTNLDGVPGRQADAYVGVGVQWEVFSGGRKARDSSAKMRIVQAMAERDSAMLDVRELAQTTWNAYHANIERTVLLDRQLSAARQAADQYATQFEAGTRTLLDVLDAERAWFNARFEDISAEAAYAFNQYKLLAVESRLGETFGVASANMPLAPDFVSRATSGKPQALFSTDIPALK